MLPKALTIAGSDSSGGAGIQADLKTFSRLRVYGMSVITALTAQNTRGISAVMDIPAEFVGQQLDAVAADIPPDALKTGMLRSAEIVETVAVKVGEHQLKNLVIDPAIRSKSGATLLDSDAIGMLKQRLLPLALMITPNIDEAEMLARIPIRSLDDMENGAKVIHDLGVQYVLIKGGHLEGDPVDLLFDGERFDRFGGTRIPALDTHGTGCVLSAAIAAHLALGESVVESVRLSKVLITEAIRHGLRIGHGQGPCDPLGIEESKNGDGNPN